MEDPFTELHYKLQIKLRVVLQAEIWEDKPPTIQVNSDRSCEKWHLPWGQPLYPVKTKIHLWITAPTWRKRKLYLIITGKNIENNLHKWNIYVYFFFFKQAEACLKIIQEEMSYRKQKQEVLKIKPTELRWKRRLAGSHNWI